MKTSLKIEDLQFFEVTKLLCHRHDLLAFYDRDNKRVTSEMPWFGQTYADLSESELSRARPEYGYYCGFAGEIHFQKNTRHHAQVCDIPAEESLVMEQSAPRVGDLIMGQVEPGRGSMRFTWWMRVMIQDKRFADIVSGRTAFSREKLEKKLTIELNGRTNKELFMRVLGMGLKIA